MNSIYPGTSAPSAVPPNPRWPGNQWLLAWNQRGYVELNPDETAPGLARDYVSRRLRERGLDGHRDLSLGCAGEACVGKVGGAVGAGEAKVLVWDRMTGNSVEGKK